MWLCGSSTQAFTSDKWDWQLVSKDMQQVTGDRLFSRPAARSQKMAKVDLMLNGDRKEESAFCHLPHAKAPAAAAGFSTRAESLDRHHLDFHFDNALNHSPLYTSIPQHTRFAPAARLVQSYVHRHSKPQVLRSVRGSRRRRWRNQGREPAELHSHPHPAYVFSPNTCHYPYARTFAHL